MFKIIAAYIIILNLAVIFQQEWLAYPMVYVMVAAFAAATLNVEEYIRRIFK